ncbi:MAG: multicopper oxidase domain-containing protein [Thermomicrobiales bacterium]
MMTTTRRVPEAAQQLNGPTMTRAITRRKALGFGLHATGVAALLGGIATVRAQEDPAAPEATPLASRPEVTPPQALRSEGGELAFTLTAQPASVDVGAAQPVTTFTYDGVLPGYTWEVQPGDVMRFTLANDLPPLPEGLHVDMTRPHQWTTTNIHVHGMHVEPGKDSDNVFITIPPGTEWDYEIEIPQDHPAGLFWYHPHRHGAVAQQVRAGMAGAIVVRGDIDEVPEIAAAKEQVLVLQALELGEQFQLLDPIPHPTIDQAFYPRTQILYTVNGVMNPKITMYPGEVQRWRLLNAAEGKFMSLRLEGHPMYAIAWDGLTLHEPEPEAEILLSAGNRVDLLIQAGEPGIYEFILSPGSSQKPNIPGMPAAVDAGTPIPGVDTPSTQVAPATLNTTGELAVRSILTVEVVGEGPEMALPTSLPAWDPPMPPVTRTRDVAYTVEREMDHTTFIDFGIDGAPFSPMQAPYQAKLETVEEWTITNGTDEKLVDHAHVFHIHVNPFKVTAINGRTLDKPLWRDTFVLTGKTGDSFTFQTHFTDFTGLFVQHCHVLTHEDLGMMEAIEVVP